MATYNSNGSQSDVIAKIASAVDGDTVTIPTGDFTWSTAGGVVISGKGITLCGDGAGRVVARSTTSVTVGTGTKVFTLATEVVASFEALKSAITAGRTLRIYRTGGAIVGGNPTGALPWLQGTVTSLIGSVLTMNITSTNSSGTYNVWIIETMPLTTITHSVSGSLISVTEDVSNSVEIYGLRFITGTGTTNYIDIAPTTSAKPTLIHDCYFESTSNLDGIHFTTNRGIVWNSSFVSLPYSMQQLPIHAKAEGYTSSWTTASTMGMDDTTGTANIYVEDCDFHAFLNACDFDDNTRSVWRDNLMNNAGFGTHGADTSNYGVRHYEAYDNAFIFNGFSDGTTMNLNWWFYLRGGTGVITGNFMPTIISGDYGNKGAINMTCMQLQRNAGPNGGWGVINTSGRSGGWNYPAPRQVGWGRVTGASTLSVWVSGGPYPGPGATWSGNYATFGGSTYKSTAANTSTSNPSVNTGQWTNTGYASGFDSITYIGDLEPLYVWNNGVGYPAYGPSDYGIDQPNSVSNTGALITCDTTANYVQINRDYYVDTTGSASSGAKPGWVPYTYPNPNRTNGGGGGSTPFAGYKRLGRYLKFSGLAG